MSGVSLQSYIKVARLDEDESRNGVIRMDANRENQLVNKSSMRGIVGTNLGLGDPGTRENREWEALNGFREALRTEYGDLIANEALKVAGLSLDGNGTLISGKVLDAVNHAKELSFDYRDVFKDQLVLHTSERGLEGIDESLRPEFVERFTRRFLAKVETTGLPLNAGLSAKIETLQELQELDTLDTHRVGEARDQLKVAVCNLLVEIVNGADSAALTEPLQAVLDQLAMLGDAEGKEALTDEERNAMLQIALRDGIAFLEASREHDGLVDKVQKLVREGTSPLDLLQETMSGQDDEMTDQAGGLNWLRARLTGGLKLHRAPHGTDEVRKRRDEEAKLPRATTMGVREIRQPREEEPLEGEIPRFPLGRFVEVTKRFTMDDELPIRLDARTRTRLIMTPPGGIGSEPETRRERERLALESFKLALVDEYGEAIAERALHEAGLLGSHKTLTERTARIALDYARQRGDERQLDVDNLIARYTSRAQMDLWNIPPNLRDEFAEQVRRRALARFDESDLLENAMAEVVEEARQWFETRRLEIDAQRPIGQQLPELHDDPETVEEARRTLTVSVANILTAIARNEDPQVLLALLDGVDEPLESLCGVEDVGEQSTRTIRGMLLSALRDAFQLLEDERGWTSGHLEEVQDNMLRDDSPLRALYRVGRESLGNDEYDHAPPISTRDWLCEKLVEGVSRERGPSGGTFSGLSRFRNDSNGESPMMPRAREALERARTQLNSESELSESNE